MPLGVPYHTLGGLLVSGEQLRLGSTAFVSRLEEGRLILEIHARLNPIAALPGTRMYRSWFGLALCKWGRRTAWSFILAVATCFLSAQAQTNDLRSLAESADAARRQRNIPDAIELYKQAVVANPSWPEGWWFLGILQYDLNQYAPARDAFTQYIRLTPNAGPALALKGLCEFEMGQYPESLQDLQQGVTLGAANQPRNARIILYHQALLLNLAGSFEQSFADFKQLAAQRPDNQDLALGLGLAGLRRRQLPGDVTPEQTALVSSVGKASSLLMSGDLDGASQAFQALFARYPDVPNLHYTYGYLLFATSPEQAADQLHEELKVSPHSANAHAMLAWAESTQGDFPAARDDGAKAVAEDSALTMGQLTYGRALVETGKIEDGVTHLEDVLRTEPGNLEAHLTLAKAYSKLGRSEDARRERLQCLAISDQGAAPAAKL